MNKTYYILLLLTLFGTSTVTKGQSTHVIVSAEGQKYNEKDFSQEFVYNLWVDSSNSIVGSIIQENKSPDKEWCAYLKIYVLGKKNKTDSVQVLQIFTTTPYKLEPQGKANNAKTYTQKANWKQINTCKYFNLLSELISVSYLTSKPGSR